MDLINWGGKGCLQVFHNRRIWGFFCPYYPISSPRITHPSAILTLVLESIILSLDSTHLYGLGGPYLKTVQYTAPPIPVFSLIDTLTYSSFLTLNPFMNILCIVVVSFYRISLKVPNPGMEILRKKNVLQHFLEYSISYYDQFEYSHCGMCYEVPQDITSTLYMCCW